MMSFSPLGSFLVSRAPGFCANRSAGTVRAQGSRFRGAFRRIAAVLLAGAAGLLAGRSSGADGVWIFNGSDNWSTASRWAGSDIADGAGATAWFTNNISASRTITVDGGVASRTLGVLNIGDSVADHYVFNFGGSNGGTLVFDNNGAGAQLNLLAFGTANGTTCNATLPLILADSLCVSNATGNRTLSVQGGISGTGNLKLARDAAGAITLSGNPINPVGMIASAGAGNGTVTISSVIGENVASIVQSSPDSLLTLSGNNAAYTNGLVIKAGTVYGLTSGNCFGTGSGIIALGDAAGSANATLSGGTTIARPISVTAGNTGRAAVTAGATANFTGPVTLNNHDLALYTTTAAALTLSGGTTGTGNLLLDAQGNRTITLSVQSVNPVGVITNLGAGNATVTISGGVGANVARIVQASTNSALTISGATVLSVAGGGKALINASPAGEKLLTVSGGTSGTGALRLKNDSVIANGITVSGTTLNHAGAITNSGTGSGAVLIGAVIGPNVTRVVQDSAASMLSLTANNTYTGGTTVENGTLHVANAAGSGTGTGPVSVNGGGTLAGTGSCSGPVTVATGGTVAPGLGGTAGGTLTVASLNLAAGSVCAFALSAAPANDRLVVSGANGLTIAPGAGIALYEAGTADPWATRGTYGLIQYSGTLIGSATDLTIANPHEDLVYTFFAEDNWIKVRTDWISVAALAASDLTPSSARMNGRVIDVAADDPAVWFCWDTGDKGVASTGDWAHVESVGIFGKGQAFDRVVGDLVSGDTYTYRVFAENTSGAVWSPEAVSFKPVYLPAVVNGGALPVSPGTVLLRGEVTEAGSEAPNVWFLYWRVGDTATNSVDIGRQASTCEAPVSGLAYFADYGYMLMASNQAGVVISGTAGFTAPGIYHVSPAGSDVNDGLSWAHALATIGGAVAKSDGGEAILVSNGVYAIGAEIAVNQPLVLTGVGPDKPVVKRTAGSNRIFNINHADAVLDGFAITGGESPAGDLRGAGILLSAGTVRNCVISNNISELKTSGAGIYVVSGLLTNSVIRDNHSKDGPGGGGVYMAGGIMAGCVVRENGKSGYRILKGAGVNLQSGSLATDCVIENNHGAGSTYCVGGGVQVEGGVLKRSRILNNAVTGNASGGGGINLVLGRVENCLVVSNRCLAYASLGSGGVAVFGGSLVNCTVVDNQTAMWSAAATLDSGAGILWNNGGTISNTIIYNNTRLGCRGQRNIGGHPGYTNAFFHCSAPELAAGHNSNRPDDPRFVDYALGDFRLRADSPCLDAGGENGLTEDFNGLARPRDGDGDGVARLDMGAFERADAAAEFTCHFLVATNEAFHALDAVFTAKVFGPNTNGLVYVWDFGNGTLAGPGLGQVARHFTTGFYAVTLTVSNALDEVAVWCLPGCIRVGAPVAYVAPVGGHQVPYDTWAKAATNILAAVQAAVVTPGGATRVVVSNGNYSVPSSTASILVNRGITVESLAGAAATVVTGIAGADVYPNFDIDHPGAVVAGFTSRNANFGAVVHRGTLRRCILSDNTGNINRGFDSGFGAGVRLFGGLVEECLILNNYVYGSTYVRGGGVWMTGPSLLRNCTVSRNACGKHVASVAAGINCEDVWNRPVIRNCLVSENSAGALAAANSGAGILLAGGRVESCTVVSNNVHGAAGCTGGGMYATLGTVENTIIYSNTLYSSVNENISSASTFSLFSYCCAPELTSGERGNRSADPRFADLARRDFRLREGSPCINTGRNADWMAAALDLDGGRRVRMQRVDMGVYEYGPPGGAFIILR